MSAHSVACMYGLVPILILGAASILPLTVGVAVNRRWRSKGPARAHVASYAATTIAGAATCYMLWPFPAGAGRPVVAPDGFGYVSVMIVSAGILVLAGLATKHLVDSQIEGSARHTVIRGTVLQRVPLTLLLISLAEIAVLVLVEYNAC